MRELRVGYVPDQHRHSLIGAAPYCRHVPLGDWNRLLARAGRLLNRCTGRELLEVSELAHTFRERRLHPGVDVLHLCNQVSYGRLPWLTSFDVALPRLAGPGAARGSGSTLEQTAAHPRTARTLAALATDRCRRLLALSRCAADTQGQLLASALPAAAARWHAAIAGKTMVLPPPQPRLLSHMQSKPPLGGRRLRLLFITADFRRDGGLELIEAAAPLVRRQRAPIELTIVGALASTDAARAHAGPELQQVRALLSAHRDWIHHHDGLEESALLQKMREADVGLLPTCADDYGFAVLQMQACGCPVISTDVRALPEINDAQRGWLIGVPKDALGQARCATGVERVRLSQAIREGLTHCLQEVLAQPLQARARGERALQGIEAAHDPTHIGERLFDIYLECVAGRAPRSRATASP